MSNFLSILSAEHYKTKRNKAILAFILFPLIMSLVALVYITNEYTPIADATSPYNPWKTPLGMILINIYTYIYPFFVSILAYSLCEIEYRNHCDRQLLTLPFPVWKLYGVKIIYLFEIIIISVLLSYICFLGCALFLNYLSLGLPFFDYDMQSVILFFYIKLLIAVLTIGTLQFCISLIFRNLIIPLGFSCFMIIFLMLFSKKWAYSYLLIYNSTFKASDAFWSEITQFELYDYWNCVYIILFIVLGYILYKRYKG